MQYYQFHHKIHLPKVNQSDNDNKSLYVIFFFNNIHDCSKIDLDIVNVFNKSYINICQKYSIIPNTPSQWQEVIYPLFSTIKNNFSHYTFNLIKMEIKVSNTISISTADEIYIGRNNIKTQMFLLNKKINTQLNINNNLNFEKDNQDDKNNIINAIKNIFTEN